MGCRRPFLTAFKEEIAPGRVAFVNGIQEAIDGFRGNVIMKGTIYGVGNTENILLL